LVADPGGFAREIVIEADEHTELGEGAVTGVDSLAHVRHRPFSVGVGECIARSGLGLR